jgi:peptide deformylase
MFEDLRIIFYPDPRLKKMSEPVTVFDESLRLLAGRMFELMREARGVGLAAPQVGQNIRLFVMNPTGEPGDDRVYVNPVLSDNDGGEEEAEEGCLSLPGIHINVVRSKQMRMNAYDLDGNPVEEIGSCFIPRVWQHETDHLNGTMLTDRMGPVARMTHRRILTELKEQYDAANPPPPPPPKPRPKLSGRREKRRS